MKSPRIRHIIWLLLLWLMPGSFVVMGQNVNEKSAQEAENVQDTIAPRYSVRKTVPGTLKDLSPHPADLQSPMNLRTEAEYDAKTNRYYIRTKLGNTEIGVPMVLTPEEYLDWTLKQSMQSYYRQKNGEQNCLFQGVFLFGICDFFSNGGDDPQAVFADVVKERVELPPLGGLCDDLLREKELINGHI